jgi:hypothetical protein
MSLAELASLASSVAVVVSLVFLGLQIRQSNRNQRSLMQQGRSARNVELLSRLSDPRVSDVISRSANGETLSDQDCFVLYGYLTSVFWSYEDCFFQFHLGMLDPKSWASDGITLRSLLGNPAYARSGGSRGAGSVMNTSPFSMDSPPNPGTTSRPICPTRSGNTSRERENAP